TSMQEASLMQLPAMTYVICAYRLRSALSEAVTFVIFCSGLPAALQTPLDSVEQAATRTNRGTIDYETLQYGQTAHALTLNYNRQGQHSAVNRTMNAELHHAWQRFRDDPEAFVLVITGAGETTFCAGWDLQDAAELDTLGEWDVYRVGLYNSPGACGYTR